MNATGVMLYSFGLHTEVSEGAFDVTLRMPAMCKALRPSRILTNVTTEGQVVISSLVIGGENQLIDELDAYVWSAAYYEESLKSALKELGCETAEEFERRQDAREFEDVNLPNPGRAELPTILANAPVTMAGRYLAGLPDGKKFAMSIVGYGYSS
jgi:hypothetical protein